MYIYIHIYIHICVFTHIKRNCRTRTVIFVGAGQHDLTRSFNITDEKGRVLRALVPFIAAGTWLCGKVFAQNGRLGIS